MAMALKTGEQRVARGHSIRCPLTGGAVDAKLTEQVKAGVFPVRLSNENWVSGESVWLLDVIAADRKQATAVLANFKQLSGDKPVKVHPIVARSVEAGVLDKMRVRERA